MRPQTESKIVPEKPPVYVHLLPSLIPPGALRGGTAIVIDVLRATTVMVHALAAGCEAIMPCLEIEQARTLAESLGRDRTILAGGSRSRGLTGETRPARSLPRSARARRSS